MSDIPFKLIPAHNGHIPITRHEAWFIARRLYGRADSLNGAPISPWLAGFLSRVDVRTSLGQELLESLIGDEGIKLVNQQDPRQSEPEFAPIQVNSRWQLYPVKDLDNLPSVQWLIPGEIPAKALTVLFGGSGTGKSFVALDYALRIAQSLPVVYVAAEGETGYRDRTKVWIAHHKQQAGGLFFCFNPVRMLDVSTVQSFADALRPLSPGLVILDTLARCMLGGDENSARDMGQFIESCGLIKQQLGAAVLVVHHTGKNGTSERGSSALRGASDSMIELSNDDGLITLTCSKSKDSTPFPKRHLRMVPVELVSGATSCVVIPAEKVMDVKGQPLTDGEKAILQALKMETFFLPGARVAQLIGVTNLSERSIHRILSRCIRFGYVEQGKRGDPYKITEEGFNLKLD